jgi:hypothetical protein
MTKKDYIVIANILGHIEEPRIRHLITALFSDHLRADNPAFDRMRFVSAVEHEANALLPGTRGRR